MPVYILKRVLVVCSVFAAQAVLVIIFHDWILYDVLRMYFKPSVQMGIAEDGLYLVLTIFILAMDIVAVTKPKQWIWILIGSCLILIAGMSLGFTARKFLFALVGYSICFAVPLFVAMFFWIRRQRVVDQRVP